MGRSSVVGAVLLLLLVPLLPLLPLLQLPQQRLPEGLVELHDALQLLHEQQLQHALVRVQVGQLEQLPLQDVVVPGGNTGVGWKYGCGGGKPHTSRSGGFSLESFVVIKWFRVGRIWVIWIRIM